MVHKYNEGKASKKRASFACALASYGPVLLGVCEAMRSQASCHSAPSEAGAGAAEVVAGAAEAGAGAAEAGAGAVEAGKFANAPSSLGPPLPPRAVHPAAS